MAMCTSPSRVLAAATTCLLAALVSAQVADDFTDGDLTTGTAWSGDNTIYVVVDDGGNQRLRSNSPGAANYYLSTPNTIVDDARWEFFIDLRFATSGANYADIYLMSDAADLSGGVNGYLLRVGGTLDRIELFRSDAGTANTTGLQSPDGIVNSSTSNPFLLRVERTAAGTWTLQFDDGASGTYVNAGSTTDMTYIIASHFGLRIEQSSAASVVNNHFFDDFSVGPIPVDLTPPSLLSATVVSATQVDLLFDEPLDATTVTPTVNYVFSGGPGTSSTNLMGPATVRVTATTPFQSGTTYTITVNNVADLAGNPCAGQSAQFLYFVPDVAVYGDVVINEIMVDPSPTVGLPDAEFVELYNTTTDKTFDLEGWTYNDGGSELILPSAALPPGGYVIITGLDNVAALAAYGTAVAPAGSVSLSNTGDLITIKEPGGITIDAVAYSDSWYNDPFKADGGWSLERINPITPCSGAGNWTASNAALGGTPGEQNSVYVIVADVTPPSLVSVLVSTGTQVQLVFSEAMDLISLSTGIYTFNPALEKRCVRNQIIIGAAVDITFALRPARAEFFA